MATGPIRIALLVPSTFLIDEPLCRLAAEIDLVPNIYRVASPDIEDSTNPEDVAGMVRFMGDPASLSDIARLAKQTCPDVIAWACTSGSFIDGGTMGDRQVEALSTAADVPAITTSKAILAALHDLNASRVGVITPYLPEIGARFVDYLEAAGFVVTSQEHLGGGSDIEVGALCPESFGEAAAKVRNGSDAIAIPCTAVDEFKIRPALAGIEQPIVFANRATLQQAAALVGKK